MEALTFPNQLMSLKSISSQKGIAKYWHNSPMLSALTQNAEAIDNLEMSAGNKKIIEILEQNLEHLHGLANDWINAGHYSNIHDKFRLIFSYCCALKAVLFFKNVQFEKALKACDEGLLKGNDLEDGSLTQFAMNLCQHYLPKCPSFNEVEDFSKFVYSPLKNSQPIPRLQLPSLSSFYTEFYSCKRPLIIKGLVNEFPAFKKWRFSWLNELCGHRTVPVEIGSKYTDEDWRQMLMTFNEYLTQYVFPPEKPNQIGYLAQHRLIDQVPELLEDLHPIPDYCEFGFEGATDPPPETINVFIGPAGTVSPLHTDPRHNLFCQIRGRKFVRLISPDQSNRLYLFDDLMRQNSSQVDAEQPNCEEFPDFEEVVCEDAVVEPGECLFIPRGHFHHVRALERSISVSIWFGPNETNKST